MKPPPPWEELNRVEGQCTSKRRFPDERAALGCAAAVARRGAEIEARRARRAKQRGRGSSYRPPPPLRPYRCEWCDGWHLTPMTEGQFRRQERNQQDRRAREAGRGDVGGGATWGR